MKQQLKIIAIAAILAVAPLLMFAQVPPDPPGGGGGGNPGGPPVGAPVGNGLYILSALALAYASRKVFVLRSSPNSGEA